MENSADNKVLGIEIGKYTKISYILILIASGFGVFSNVIALVGLTIPGGLITGLLGLAGLILAVLGLFAFKDKFNALDIAHFKYIGIMFLIFFVIYVVLVPILMNLNVLGLLIVILIAAGQFILLFAGYRTQQAGIEPTKATIEANIKSLIKR